MVVHHVLVVFLLYFPESVANGNFQAVAFIKIERKPNRFVWLD